METKDFIKLFKKRHLTVIGITLFFVTIGLIITLLQPLKYSSKSRLLILQPNISADAYTVARSNEYVGGLISEIIYSGSFLDSLKNSNAVFDRNYFSGTYKQNVKKWGKTIFARNSGDTGVIDIEVYHTNPEEAKRISSAVNQLIISGQSPYKFNPEQTKINVIDEPVVSSFPVKPNIPTNFIISLLFGFTAACSYIYLFPKEKLAEKLTQELFGLENATNRPQGQSAPAYQSAAPENLPVFFQTKDELAKEPEAITETDEITFNNNYQFHGNISNVLGE